MNGFIRFLQHPFVRLVTTAFCVWLLLRSINLHRALDSLLAASPWWILGAVGFTALVLTCQVIIWGLFLRCNGHNVAWLKLGSLYLQGLFWGHVTPGGVGGDAVRVLSTASLTGEGDAVASLAASRLAEGVGIMGVGAIAVITLHSWFGGLSYLLGALIVLAIAAGWYALLMADSLVNWLDEEGSSLKVRFVKLLKTFAQACKGYRENPRVVGLSLLFGVAYWLINLLALKCLAYAVGVNVAWNIFAVMVPVTALAALAPFAINGFGLREGMVVAVLSKAGIGLAHAFAVAILIDLQMLPFVLIGALCYLLERRKDK